MQTVGSWGSGNGDLSYPLGVAINQDAGDVYVADYNNNRVEEFTTAGSFVRTFGSSGSGNGELSGPYGLAVDGDGNVWVADTWNNRVEEFTAGGDFVQAFGSWGTANGQMEGPKAICVFDGHIYVADTTNNRIEEFTTTGSFIRAFGSTGSGDGQFNSPEGLTGNAKNGYLYVTDSGNGRIQAFTTEGRFVATFASTGSGSGHLSSPKGIAFSSTGDAFVTDQANNRVARWNADAPVVDTTSYDDAAQPSHISIDRGASTLGSFSYSRDNANQLSGVTSTGVPSDNHTYSHNSLHQLAAQDSTSITYDAGDHITSLPDGTSLTYDPAGQLAGATHASDHVTFSFDSKGERTAGGTPGGPSSTYHYNQAGELTEADVGSTTAIYQYDGAGLRTSKSVGSTTLSFTWDTASGSRPLLLTDGGSAFLYGPDDAPLEQLDSSGDLQWLHHDQQQSTRILTDAAGAVVGTATYDALGGHPTTTGATSHLGYDGEYTDAETGFVYLRARYYDPATGQFVTVDPAVAVTFEAYQYANNDPLDSNDPAGLCPQAFKLPGLSVYTGHWTVPKATRIGNWMIVASQATKGAPAPPIPNIPAELIELAQQVTSHQLEQIGSAIVLAADVASSNNLFQSRDDRKRNGMWGVFFNITLRLTGPETTVHPAQGKRYNYPLPPRHPIG